MKNQNQNSFKYKKALNEDKKNTYQKQNKNRDPSQATLTK